MSKVAKLSISQVLEQLQEGVVVREIEDVPGVIAGKGLFVNLLADAQESQVVSKINLEEGFRSSTRRVPIDVPRVGQVLSRDEVPVTSPGPNCKASLSKTFVACLEVVPNSRVRQ